MPPPQSLTLITATSADLDAMMSVMDAAFDPRFGEAWTATQLASLIAVPGTRLCLVLLGERPVGFYAARSVAGESELMLLAVIPDARRLGIGQRLLDDWQRWGEECGVAQYFLEMRADNPARHLYTRTGFSKCGERPAYYLGKDGIKRDAITMRYSRMHGE
jgi:[ribosomal protein S18]-alanine N-acetyltransferase